MFISSIRLALVAGIFAAISACGSVTESVSDVQFAEDLLNRGEFEQAKSLLESLRISNKSDDHVTVLLASAYAGGAGINIINAWSMFEPLAFENKTSLTLASLESNSNQTPDGTNVDSKEFEKSTFKFLSELATTFNVLGKIPTITKQGRIDVDKSISILTEIAPDQKNHVRSQMYSSLLNLFQFSTYIREGLPKTQAGENFSLQNLICGLNPIEFINSISTSLPYLTNAVTNAETAIKSASANKKVKLAQLKGSLTKMAALQGTVNSHAAAITALKTVYSNTLCTE